ncbi:MAG: ABC transporter ATP-binding protein [Clostridiales bacterium]|nr:ABC transporter ATP-binding protein [Clostridiales bacterium]
MAYESAPLLSVKNLSLSFPGSGNKKENTVLSRLSFDIRDGEIFGIVGESGSGKTITSLAIAGLLPESAEIKSGEILFRGENVLAMSPKNRRGLLGREIGMIFQEPLSSLDPLMTIGKHLSEVITAHHDPEAARERSSARKTRILEMLAHVGFHDPDRIYRAYPHQISGGQRQRALIAGALLLKPSLLIADEPTSSLDSVTQNQILDQIRRISQSFHLTVLFISHDLKLMERMCDRMAVLHNRRIVECDATSEILHSPGHPHTATLLRGARFEIRDTKAEKTAPSVDAIPLIRIESLNAGYSSGFLHAGSEEKEVLTDVSLKILPGEILGLIGSSGCGKTTLARVMTGLLPGASGQIYQNETLFTDFSKSRRFRKPSVGLVFQDPYTSLNPYKTIGWLLEEPLRVNHLFEKKERRDLVLQMMTQVGLPKRYFDYYPNQLSGGQRQRVALAMSLMLSPSLIIADEPVSSLDVTVQTQILRLLWDINQKSGIAFLFITHDLKVIRSICDRVAVMDNGRIIETGRIGDVFRSPTNPVTRLLVQ